MFLCNYSNYYYDHNYGIRFSAMSLVYIIDDALQDIYIGVMNILLVINSKKRILSL